MGQVVGAPRCSSCCSSFRRRVCPPARRRSAGDSLAILKFIRTFAVVKFDASQMNPKNYRRARFLVPFRTCECPVVGRREHKTEIESNKRSTNLVERSLEVENLEHDGLRFVPLSSHHHSELHHVLKVSLQYLVMSNS